jgi:hypothetical protein
VFFVFGFSDRHARVFVEDLWRHKEAQYWHLPEDKPGFVKHISGHTIALPDSLKPEGCTLHDNMGAEGFAKAWYGTKKDPVKICIKELWEAEDTESTPVDAPVHMPTVTDMAAWAKVTDDDAELPQNENGTVQTPSTKKKKAPEDGAEPQTPVKKKAKDTGAPSPGGAASQSSSSSPKKRKSNAKLPEGGGGLFD